MPGGFGSLMNRCTNFDSANDFIIVIFPGNVNFLLDHVLIIFSTFCSMPVVFLFHMSKTSAVKVTPNILKGPWFQSSLKSLHKIRLDLFMDPIHIALVFQYLILDPTLCKMNLIFLMFFSKTFLNPINWQVPNKFDDIQNLCILNNCSGNWLIYMYKIYAY